MLTHNRLSPNNTQSSFGRTPKPSSDAKTKFLGGGAYLALDGDMFIGVGSRISRILFRTRA